MPFFVAGVSDRTTSGGNVARDPRLQVAKIPCLLGSRAHLIPSPLVPCI